MIKKLKTMLAALVVVLSAVSIATAAAPLGAEFTYQGRLSTNTGPANGNFDFEFTLMDDALAGVALGLPVDVEDVKVSDGYFTVVLDFGLGQMNGDARWLEIGVRAHSGSPGAYDILDPRQPITPTPYAQSLVLPYSALQSSAASLFQLTQIGAGPALAALNQGTGTGIQANILNSANDSPALAGTTNGGGRAVFGFTSGTGNAGWFQVNNDSNDEDAVVAMTNGSGDALYASSAKGTAGEFEITNPTNNENALNVTTAGTGRAALIRNVNPLSSLSALLVNNVGAGSTLYALAGGLGSAAIFKITNAGSNATALHVETNGPGDAIRAVKTEFYGAAVHAEAAGWGGVALNVAQGYVRAEGAGVGTNTWVFIAYPTNADRRDDYSMFLNHPLCNGDPNAILFVTHNDEHSLTVANRHMTVVGYDHAFNMWYIRNVENEDLYEDYAYNVMVIKP